MAVKSHIAGISEDEGLAGETGPLALLPGEEWITETAGTGGARFILTDQRVLYAGGSEDQTISETARIADVGAVKLERRSRDGRSAVWGVMGFIAAFGVWQVTPNESVGAIAAAVVALVSIALLADYWFKRPGIMLTFQTPGGAVGGQVDSADAGAAEMFAARFEHQRAQLGQRVGPGTPSRPFGAIRHPLL